MYIVKLDGQKVFEGQIGAMIMWVEATSREHGDDIILKTEVYKVSGGQSQKWAGANVKRITDGPVKGTYFGHPLEKYLYKKVEVQEVKSTVVDIADLVKKPAAKKPEATKVEAPKVEATPKKEEAPKKEATKETEAKTPRKNRRNVKA